MTKVPEFSFSISPSNEYSGLISRAEFKSQYCFLTCCVTLDKTPPLWALLVLLVKWRIGASQVVFMVKNPPAKAEDTKHEGSIPE